MSIPSSGRAKGIAHPLALMATLAFVLALALTATPAGSALSANPTAKAVQSGSTVTFYYDDVDHSSEDTINTIYDSS